MEARSPIEARVEERLKKQKLGAFIKDNTVCIQIKVTDREATACPALERAALIAHKNVNRLESMNLRTLLGYDTGPHVPCHQKVLYSGFLYRQYQFPLRNSHEKTFNML